MKKIQKAYFHFFYRLCCLFKSISDDGWEEWKALLIVGVTTSFILINIDLYIKILFKVGFILELPKFAFGVLFLIIALFHYLILLHNDGWKQYEVEFKQYSKEKNRAIDLLFFFFVLFILGNLIFAFYQLSLIDWTKYR
jgi:hypothetical protein